MPIDTSIPLRAYEGQFNPAAALQQGLQLRDMMQQSQARDMQFQDAAEARTEKRTLRDLMRGAVSPDGQIDPAKLRGAYAQTGNVEGLMAFDASQGQQAKAQREAEKARLEQSWKEHSMTAQLATTAVDQPSYTRALQQAQAFGLDVSQLPAQFDPAIVGQLRQQAMTVAERDAAEYRRLSSERADAQFDETRRSNRVAEGQRAESNSIARTNAGGGKPPAGYRYTPDGNLVAIPGGPAGGGKLTEDQGKATGNYRVMREALGTLNTVKGYSPTLLANALDAGDLTGTKLSQTDRRALNAQRAFVVAALRAESGATYGPSEVIDKIRTLFPVPGDEKDVLADKARLRQEFAMAAKVRAGTGVADYVPSDKRPKTRPVAGGTLTPPVDGVRNWKPR